MTSKRKRERDSLAQSNGRDTERVDGAELKSVKGRGITTLDVEEIEEDGTDGQTDQDRHCESGTGDMNTVPTDSTWNFRQDKQRRSTRTVGD